jgi:hypothetical protein
MANIPLRRSIALNKVVAEQIELLLKVTGENVNRLVNRLINEEYIRKVEKSKK